MKIAILGGGFTGLTAAYYLNKHGHEVSLYEKQTDLGGLAAGFKAEGWDWFLERAYHHVFASDSDILGFAEETGFSNFYLNTPSTASLYDMGDNNYRIFTLDTPQDLLKFPLLSPFERLQVGAAIAGMKVSPFLDIYQQKSAKELMSKWMGERAYEVMFGEMFRKKFGKYAENILAAFMWARLKKRTKKLGYVEGGFQIFINYLEHLLEDNGVEIKKGITVKTIRQLDTKFGVVLTSGEEGIEETVSFDKVISTLPTPVVTKVATEIVPAEYLTGLSSMQYLNAACLIVESSAKLLESAYWLSVCVPDFPMMVLVQHTNMVDAAHYGGKHILYIANYIEKDHELLRLDGEGALEYYKPALDKLNPVFHKSIERTFYFKAPFAQPIFDKQFVKVKPDFKTPVEGFYMANLDMTYPYDRGTNYAVKLGKDVAELIKE